MKASDIRESFLSYFEKNGHARVKSSSLVPSNDPTLFFTNAGMVQFKDVFTGLEKRDYKRACSSQKCMRVSGKHNDLENVGHTPRHHTFFEMLGNFSFGDYFKEEAIAFGWEFLTKVMGLAGQRMYVTIFNDDDEAERLWTKHVKKDKIFRLGEKDNFWAMGDTGPCGPCSEIIWDFGSGPVKAEDLDSTRFMEIWNLVFMQFQRFPDGGTKPLARPSIDTGMGLERLSAVMQGKSSNWESDLFASIVKKVAGLTGQKVGKSPEADVAMRVIADHARASAFLISDGVTPSNEGRGYVLRRILRRAIRYGKRLGQDAPFIADVLPAVVDEMGGAYPELATHQHFIYKVMRAEEERFLETLDRGLELLKAEMAASKGKVISGDVAFKLYDTYGFPLDVTQMIAGENGFLVDEAGFESDMERQRERARASWKGSGEEAVSTVWRDLASSGILTTFVGYSENTSEANILAIVSGGKLVNEAKEGMEVDVVADVTPFYGESGGQAGDIGVAVREGVELEVTGTKKPLPNIISHRCKVVKGKISKGMRLTFAVDAEARQASMCNHTATHLLHKALREILGEHVKQAGSLVEPGRLRFDFSHFQAMTNAEIKDVERHVNEAIRRNLPVVVYELTYEEAISKGALAFFGEKYGKRVRMVDVSGHSTELCGGTHVSMTGEIGMFKITSESSVAAGVRRIEAVTAAGVENLIDDIESERMEVASIVKAGPSEAVDRVRRMAERISSLEKELKAAKAGAIGYSEGDMLSKARNIGQFKALALVVPDADRKSVSELAERLRDKLAPSVVALGCKIDGKAFVVCAVSKELTPKVKAGEIVARVSEQLGGKGGGRPDFAQGGGADVAGLEAAMENVYKLLT
jgi:alanyl-tRNA synthetase